MAMANTKIYQKMKMKSFLSIERNIIDIYIYNVSHYKYKKLLFQKVTT